LGPFLRRGGGLAVGAGIVPCGDAGGLRHKAACGDAGVDDSGFEDVGVGGGEDVLGGVSED
jgi:hypothetical protein